MASQVYRPQKRNELSDIGTIGGAVVGGIYGGPGGAAGGAALGSQLGGVLDKQGGAGGESTAGMSAAERRLAPSVQQPQVQDPLSAVKQAQIAVVNLPADQRAEFEPLLKTGAAALRRNQGVA